MAIFTVHVPATRAGEPPPAEKVVFLRDGFSLSAMIFGPLWLAWNRAWIAAIGWSTLLAAIAFIGVKLGFPKRMLALVTIALSVVLGFEGVRLIAWNLAWRGFRESSVVTGDNIDDAEEVFFHDWRPATPLPPAEAAREEPRS